MAECVERDDRILLFGTGHSHMLAEEGHYRAGGLANVVPMLQSALMLHESSILSGSLERTAGVARPVFERYQPQAGEMLFIFSNSGVNIAPVEMALLAKEHGLISVAVCSLAYARVAPLSSAGRRLFEVTDYVIDNGGEQGDSLIALEGTAVARGTKFDGDQCAVVECTGDRGRVYTCRRAARRFRCLAVPICPAEPSTMPPCSRNGVRGIRTCDQCGQATNAMSDSLAIGIDLGATKIAAALITRTGEVLAAMQIETDAIAGFESVADRVAKLIEAMREAASKPIAGIGIGTPGQVDLDSGMVKDAVNLGWQAVPLVTAVKARLKREIADLDSKRHQRERPGRIHLWSSA